MINGEWRKTTGRDNTRQSHEDVNPVFRVFVDGSN